MNVHLIILCALPQRGYECIFGEHWYRCKYIMNDYTRLKSKENEGMVYIKNLRRMIMIKQ